MTLRHIIKIIRRDSLSLASNIIGLSLGLAASILLATFILFEISFDRHFSRGERIYRLNSIWIEEGEPGEMPINLRSAYHEIPGNVAGIETAIQIYRGFQREIIEGGNRHEDLDLVFADPGFFRLFDLKLLYGSPENALSDPASVVLPEKIARRVFGTTDVVGRSFEMEGRSYTISAVTGNIPPNTHFTFDMLMSMNSEPDLETMGGLEFFTYFLLEEGFEKGSVLETIRKENTRLLTERFSMFENSSFDSRLVPLRDLHLGGHVNWDLTPPGSMKTIYILLLITLVVMGMALTNFINLYILNGAKRSREIGIRKVNGARRKGMIWQFYLETLVVVSISFVMGSILAILLLPSFAGIMQRESFISVTGTSGLYLVLAGIYLITVALSGFYPALLLSRADPVSLIRGTVNPAGDKRILLRAASVIQLCIAMCLLAILLGINTQIRFLRSYSPGYNPEQLVQVYNLNEKLFENYQALKDNLLSHSSIQDVSASSHWIGRGSSGQGIFLASESPEKVRSIREYRILPGLCRLYQFRLLAGRFLEEDRSSDRSGVILNEAAVRILGFTPQEIIGEQVIMHRDPLVVTGVVEDFLYMSAAYEIEPLIFTAYSTNFRNISVRYADNADPQEVLRTIDESIKNFDPEYVMLTTFPTDTIRSYYRNEERLQKILLSGSLLSVLIVLLGIYALVSHNLLSRTKEIGIRKVMGGSARQMMKLIYISTLKWSLIASAFAVPPALLYLGRWLNDYAVRIQPYWWIFACSIMVVLLFQTLITLVKTSRTAHRNPVEALRYE